MELDYNTTTVVGQNGDAVPQFNGNISEEIWKGGYDNDKNSFRFTYDKANRLKGEKYAGSVSSQWGSSWDYSVRYDESIDSYDRNGNIQVLNRATKLWGFVDAMHYNYTGNQLNYIDDWNGDQSGQGFKDVGGVDYGYDANGNLLKDGNKAISSIQYNHLNLPTIITMTGKGTITYAYDASGTKLSKTVVDQTTTPNKISIFKYAGDFTYKSTYLSGGAVPTVDTLEFIAHEEGRLRPKKIDTTLTFTPANLTYIYDYFLKDHLGNVRSVITTETQTDLYAATMETASQAKEVLLFSGVNETRSAKPGGFDTDGTNQSVARVHGNINTTGNKRVGPAIILKVMAGDTVSLSTYGWYVPATQPPATGVTDIVTDLASQFTGGATALGGNKNGTFSNSDITSMLTGILSDVMTDRNTNNYNTSRPKAFLNWVVVDENFRITQTANHKGAVQIPLISGAMQKQLMVGLSSLKIRKNGYLYVFVSNESNQDVFFDNLVVNHKRGPVLEETAYYPFGMKMEGISTKSNKSRYTENYKNTFQNQERTSAFDLSTYEFRFRMYDPQYGRFWQNDPLSQKFVHNSTYAFSENKVTSHIEFEGLESVDVKNPFLRGMVQPNLQRDVTRLTTAAAGAGSLKATLGPSVGFTGKLGSIGFSANFSGPSVTGTMTSGGKMSAEVSATAGEGKMKLGPVAGKVSGSLALLSFKDGQLTAQPTAGSVSASVESKIHDGNSEMKTSLKDAGEVQFGAGVGPLSVTVQANVIQAVTTVKELVKTGLDYIGNTLNEAAKQMLPARMIKD